MFRPEEDAGPKRFKNEVFAIIAVCEAFDLQWPTDLEWPDHPYDLILPSGRKAIAKYGVHSGDPFLIDDDHTHQLHTWDVGILVWPHSDNSVSLIGWISHFDFWDKCQLHILPDGRRSLMVGLDEMELWEELKEYECQFPQPERVEYPC